MSSNSKIEWCDHTYNHWIGCTKVSPGCANCYAEKCTRARVLRHGGQETWGKGAKRSRTKTAGDPIKWNKAASSDGRGVYYATHGAYMPERRPRVFCSSLSDWLDEEVPIEWLKDLLVLIQQTPNLDWLLLTKRPENFASRIQAVADFWQSSCEMAVWWTRGIAPSNVWIGTTTENQEMADKRIPLLLSIPAKVRFLSCEPLLGPVKVFSPCDGYPLAIPMHTEFAANDPLISWIICGGESGSNARPMHPDWARSLRNECQAAGVPFFFKQWGEHAPHFNVGSGVCAATPEALAKIQSCEWMGTTNEIMVLVGKKNAGRMLDGHEWDEFPTGKVEH